jgi:2-dehydro-3-deoxygluconokinase
MAPKEKGTRGRESDAREGWTACVGETMVQAVPNTAGWIDQDSLLRLDAAGAEANVARYLVQHNLDARVVGRIGADPFGDIVANVLEGDHVDIDALDRDSTKPTGIYFKEYNGTESRVHYFRTGSAASAMGPEVASRPVVRDAALVHVTGILPALSQSCRELMTELFGESRPRGLMSFDVNWRPALWQESSPEILLDCARRADITLVGVDEAEALWGVSTPDAIRKLLPGPTYVVTKLGSDGAVASYEGTSTFVGALSVEVVEHVGAGDAFAAGFIAGVLRSESVETCLRLGNITAAAALQVQQDVGPLPEPAELKRLLNLSRLEWDRAHVQIPRRT